ncbi:ribonuclease HII [Desertibacillus haloalkaliphilus]|uniref:ribonuclease HII n=1 Tax=Desertibacillus haloalkaliphilus TaxID=1328930 RepID=UPI001C273D14|nr:ribonuclease HII [Desertibacillus haloalkaliphilus]MBU8908173.1 ribonuclease HII [Desertibacillus haloalkaliphilus]
MKNEQYKFSVKYKNDLKNGKEFDYAGIDEVAVTSIAGPMVAAVVVLPKDHGIKELPLDSKVLLPKTLQSLAKKIEEEALFLSIYKINAQKVDELGMNRSQRRLWQSCANSLRGSMRGGSKYKRRRGKVKRNIPIVIDGNHKIPSVDNQEAIPKADSIYDNVSAASIVAKNWYDKEMIRLGEIYDRYNFQQHKGYPTKGHLKQVLTFGVCDVHRKRMAERALNNPKKKKSKVSYSMVQLKQLFSQMATILREKPEVVNPQSLQFLRQMWLKVFKENQLPTERQQWYIQMCFNQIRVSL